MADFLSETGSNKQGDDIFKILKEKDGQEFYNWKNCVSKLKGKLRYFQI